MTSKVWASSAENCRSATAISSSCPRPRSRDTGSGGSTRVDERQLEVVRRMVNEVRHGLVHLAVVDRVVVLEHEHAVVGQRVQLVEQDR